MTSPSGTTSTSPQAYPSWVAATTTPAAPAPTPRVSPISPRSDWATVMLATATPAAVAINVRSDTATASEHPGQEGPDESGDLGAVGLQREVSGVEEVDLGVR